MQTHDPLRSPLSLAHVEAILTADLPRQKYGSKKQTPHIATIKLVLLCLHAYEGHPIAVGELGNFTGMADVTVRRIIRSLMMSRIVTRSEKRTGLRFVFRINHDLIRSMQRMSTGVHLPPVVKRRNPPPRPKKDRMKVVRIYRGRRMTAPELFEIVLAEVCATLRITPAMGRVYIQTRKSLKNAQDTLRRPQDEVDFIWSMCRALRSEGVTFWAIADLLGYRQASSVINACKVGRPPRAAYGMAEHVRTEDAA